MIILVVLCGVALGIIATYVVEARRRKRNERLASNVQDAGRRVDVDGINGPIAAEGLMRGGYPPDSGGPLP